MLDRIVSNQVQQEDDIGAENLPEIENEDETAKVDITENEEMPFPETNEVVKADEIKYDEQESEMEAKITVEQIDERSKEEPQEILMQVSRVYLLDQFFYP